MSGPIVPIRGSGSFTPPPWLTPPNDDPPPYDDLEGMNDQSEPPGYGGDGTSFLSIAGFNQHVVIGGSERRTPDDSNASAFSVVGNPPADFWNGDMLLRVERDGNKKVYSVVNHRVERERRGCKYITIVLSIILVFGSILAAMEKASQASSRRDF